MRGKPRKCTVRGRVRWYVDGVDPITGKRTRTLFDTQSAADVHQEQVNAQPKPTRALDPLLDPDVTLERYAARWFWTQVTAGAWRPGTRRLASDTLTNRVLDFRFGSGPADVLGAVKVWHLTRNHIKALVTGLRQRLSARTVKEALRLCGQLLTSAVSDGLLPRHPVDQTLRTELKPLLKPQKSTPKAFTVEQAQAFLVVTAAHSRLHALYVTGFATGLRIGELTGLQCADDQVSVIAGQKVRQLRIERSLNHATSMQRPSAGPTKNGLTRFVDVARDLGALFDRVKADRPKRALKHGWRPIPPWMFVTEGGRPYAQSNVRGDFSRMLARAGLAHTGFTPHSMRHSFASWHIARGCSVKWLQQQLGHASAAFTLDVYGGWFQVRDEHAADALADALFGNTAGNTGTP